MAEEPERVTTTDARAGVGLNVVRWVLIISVSLAVIAMVVTYLNAPVATQEGATTSVDPR